LLLNPRGLLFRVTAGALLLLQCSRLYRRIAWQLIGKRVRYSMASREDLLALGMEEKAYHDRIAGSDTGCKQAADWVSGVRAIFVAQLGKEPVGWIVVAKTPDHFRLKSCWMITGMGVRHRYRGAGVGRGLLITAGTTLAQHGIDHLVASVLENNTGALALANQMGADRPSLSELISETVTSRGIHRGVTVTRTLQEGLRALYQRGILEKYRGMGCCEQFFEASAGSARDI
jgi:GNAT superfamily N-acetyltransferase